MSDRVCDQCTALTKSGNRCRNRTCRSRLCWVHLKRDQGLRIKPSGEENAGLGLYAARRFDKNAIIGPYGGRRTTRKTMERRYRNKTPHYVLCNGNVCQDARASNASAARYANTTVPSRAARRNAKLTSAFNLRAKNKAIREGTEILTTYGPGFRLIV